MKGNVNKEINRIVIELREKQAKDGAWNFCFENSIFADAYLIILIRILKTENAESLIKTLVYRIKQQQTEHGYWKLYQDETEGNLSATVEAYYALLFSGYVDSHDPKIRKAKDYIIAKGGLKKVSLYTKVMLALTGQYQWPTNLMLPIELILLPPPIPFNIFDFVGYSRVHFVPIMICANKMFSLKTSQTPDLSDLYLPETNQLSETLDINQYNPLLDGTIKNIELLKIPRRYAFQRAEEFLLSRIERDGTLYNYFSATILMIFALLALGYKRDSKVIMRAVNGLITFACNGKQYTTIQNSPSTIWDTALISYALQKAQVPINDPMVQRSVSYLLAKQHFKYGDWAVHNPYVIPGGWGFSDKNTINPDIDDTTAALRALKRFAIDQPETYLPPWQIGLSWLLSMQNNDGGWPAFEKNTNKKYTKLLPIKGVESVTIDPSSADLTGRTLEFLGSDVGLRLNHPQIRKGVHWLLSNQEMNGSWYGRWGVSYIYGTWAALTGLTAVGFPNRHPSIQRAVDWLLQIQNEDGGWGESCKSDAIKNYIPLGASTPSQTAWALDALITVYDRPIPAIKKGIQFLIDLGNLNEKEKDWRFSYPTGAGFPGNFYIHYHSYQYIWPLLALSHYQEKYANL